MHAATPRTPKNRGNKVSPFLPFEEGRTDGGNDRVDWSTDAGLVAWKGVCPRCFPGKNLRDVLSKIQRRSDVWGSF